MIRTTRPTAGNKYFIRQANGGYSTCIQGKPTDSQCNVLSNCVGYACGAFNEELALGYEKYHLNCNAENFIERAIASGLSVVKTPTVGAIICWEGAGSLAGHVAIVIEVINSNCIRTAESGYGSSNPFWITTRYNNNGRWGMNSNYPFRGFIINPNYPIGPTPEPPKPTPSDKYNIGDKVVINGPLYVNSNAVSPSGSVSNKITNITRKNPGSAHPYNTTGDLGWMNESDIQPYNEPSPTPSPATERKGLDISSYQEGISFDAIKNSEYGNFVILRGGFTGWGTGVNYNKDSCFEGFYASAKSKGIPVGCYWYSCANTYEKGVAEANYLYENCLKGKQFEYPIYIDVEDSHWQEGNKDGVTAAIKGFCETLEAKKYYVGIYGSDISGFQEKMHLDQLGAYDKWVARYGSSPQYVKSYGMWQTSSSGRIAGYGENLDTDIAYQDYETIIKNAKLNGYGDEPQPTPPEPTPTPTPTYKYNIGDKVVINGDLYISSTASSPNGYVSNKVTKITRRVDAAHPYNTEGDLGWMNESDIQPYNEPSPTPSPSFEPGDTVIVNGVGKATSYGEGDSTKNYHDQKAKIIQKIDGRPYPFALNCNNNMNGITAWFKASDIRK